MDKVRVLVVDDSPTIRHRLVEILGADPEFDVVGSTGDGRSAIELCQALRPDVVTLDMVLPVMSGLAAAEYIMAYCPTPILIVSSSTNRGELFKTYEALAAGAVDVLEKPNGVAADGTWEHRLVAMVKLVSRIKVISHPRARLAERARAAASLPTTASVPRVGAKCRLIALGASTGGPAALREILGALPDDFSLPIVIVLHMSTLFAGSFAEWLDGQCGLPVAFAKDEERLPTTGRIVLAPPGRHLVIRNGRWKLTDDPERHSCRPSADVLFESLARELGDRCAACLLTGMGRDGAEGLAAIRAAGGMTYAQDEASSVVFGMPREAISLGAAEAVLPLTQIGPALVDLAGHAVPEVGS